MNNKPQFDVFLSHNSQDKAIVRKIANELKARGIKPWLDDEQIPPGQPIQDFIEKSIQNVKSIAVFIGSEKLGSWQKMELLSLISVAADIPIIPVLLPGVYDIPNDLPFLKDRILFSICSPSHQQTNFFHLRCSCIQNSHKLTSVDYGNAIAHSHHFF